MLSDKKYENFLQQIDGDYSVSNPHGRGILQIDDEVGGGVFSGDTPKKYLFYSFCLTKINDYESFRFENRENPSKPITIVEIDNKIREVSASKEQTQAHYKKQIQQTLKAYDALGVDILLIPSENMVDFLGIKIIRNFKIIRNQIVYTNPLLMVFLRR